MTRTAILSLLLLAGLAAHGQTATNRPVGVKPDKAYADALISAHGIGTVSFNLPEGALEAMRKVNERNVIEGREIVDGRIVERWRSGHREWATTNLLTPVVGVAMTNTFREVVENLRAERDEKIAELQRAIEQYMSAEARAQRAEQRAEKLRTRLQQAIDDAKLPTTKAILQAIYDAIFKD